MKNNIRSRTIIAVISLLLMAVFSACAAPGAMESAISSPYAASDAGAHDEAVAEEAAYEAMAGDEFSASADRKIIGTANIDLVVEDSEATVKKITVLVKQIGGYVADSDFYHIEFGDGTALQGNMTLRVPAGDMDAVLEQLGFWLLQSLPRASRATTSPTSTPILMPVCVTWRRLRTSCSNC